MTGRRITSTTIVYAVFVLSIVVAAILTATQGRNFFSSANIFGSLVNIVTWQWVGYYMIIIYAALRSIDP